MQNQKNTFILIVSLLVLFFIVIRYIVDFNGLYGQDSYDYLRFTKALSEYFKTGNDPGSFFWPINYPFFGAIVSIFIPSDILSLQLLSYLSFIVSALLIYKIIDIVYDPSKNTIILYLTLSFLFSPYLLRAGIVAMSDMLALAFTLAAFLGVLNYWKSKQKFHFILAITFSVLAGFTRYHAFVVLIAPMLFAISIVIKRKNYLLFLYALLISLIFIIPTIWLKNDSFLNFTGHQWFTDWSPKNWIHHSFNTSDGIATYRFPNIIYGFIFLVHPGFYLLGFLLILFIRKVDFKKPVSKLLLIMMILNGFFIAGIPFQNLRFHILIYPFAIIMLFPAFLRLSEWGSSKLIVKKLIVVLIILIQTALFAYLFEKFHSSNKLEKAISTAVGNYPGNPVYTFAIDQAINTYEPEKDIENIWYNKYENFQKGSLFLFNETKFKKQWQGKNPWTNWENANKKYTLKTLETLPEGWILYEIQ